MVDTHNCSSSCCLNHSNPYFVAPSYHSKTLLLLLVCLKYPYIYTYNIYISYIHLTHYIHYIPATSRHPGSPGDQCPHHGGQGQEWSELRLRRAPWLPTEETSQDLGQIGVKSCYSIGNAWWLNYIMFLADFDFVFGALFGIWKSL